MNFDQYQAAAYRTAPGPDIPAQVELLHAQTGMTTELGEFASEVKRMAFYDKPLTIEMHAHMREELGDILWYVALAATALQVNLSELAEANIAKLRKRFPEKFSPAAAEARADKDGLGHRES